MIPEAPKTENLSTEQLKAELERLKDELCDMEEVHTFTFQKTQVHISAEKVSSMQAEFDEECRQYRERIALIEKELSKRGAL